MSNQRRDNVSRFIVIGITSLVAIAVLAVIVISNRPRETNQEHVELVDSLPRGIDGSTGLPYLGNPEAPVTMLIYEDLGCPNCQTFFEETEPLVLTEFVAQGDVRILIYTLAFVNSQSLPAAEGAACALDQDMFWEYRDKVYNNQSVRQFNRQNLIAFADEVGLDVNAFTLCFDLGTHTQEIIDRSSVAFDFGITGTPTTDIAGERHVGVIQFEPNDGSDGIKAFLEAALSDSQ